MLFAGHRGERKRPKMFFSPGDEQEQAARASVSCSCRTKRVHFFTTKHATLRNEARQLCCSQGSATLTVLLVHILGLQQQKLTTARRPRQDLRQELHQTSRSTPAAGCKEKSTHASDEMIPPVKWGAWKPFYLACASSSSPLTHPPFLWVST